MKRLITETTPPVLTISEDSLTCPAVVGMEATLANGTQRVGIVYLRGVIETLRKFYASSRIGFYSFDTQEELNEWIAGDMPSKSRYFVCMRDGKMYSAEYLEFDSKGKAWNVLKDGTKVSDGSKISAAEMLVSEGFWKELAEKPQKVRKFTHKDGFGDGTQYIEFDESGACTSVYKDGRRVQGGWEKDRPLSFVLIEKNFIEIYN